MKAIFEELDTISESFTHSWRTSQLNHLPPEPEGAMHSTPERAPHFGGLWEAAIKSAKKHLKRVVGTQRLDYEEFATIAAQVESCLNSRSLLATTSHSPDGVQVLTPGHFLIGRELCAYPELPIQTDPMLHRRWNLCQAITAHFWKRWSMKYLQQLQKLQKWRRPTPNLQVGDIVVIRDEATFNNHWPMAKTSPSSRDKTVSSEW